jgi:hypothetical protein
VQSPTEPTGSSDLQERRPRSLRLGRRGVVIVVAIGAVIVAAAILSGLSLGWFSSHSTGTDRIVGAELFIVYTNAPGGASIGWLGSGQLAGCVNCPLVVASGSTAWLDFNLTNLNSSASGNVTLISTPDSNPIVIVTTSPTLPLSIPAGASVSISMEIGPQGLLPSGVSNATLVGFIYATWEP